MTTFIEPARTTDAPAILALLAENHLPEAGLVEHLATALVVHEGDGIVGCAALEMYGRYALLRSVAVDARLRGQGLGRRLTRAALDLAREQGVAEVYLLTETAGGFFPPFGFAPISRADVPAAVQASVEFTTACPASALVMLATV